MAELTLEKRCAIVTGGTRGIGREIVQVLAKQGCQVIFCARDEAAVRATELESQVQDWNAVGTVADVRSAQGVEGLVAFALTKSVSGGIDVLVNNAGRAGGGPTAGIDDELWADVMDTNLNSVFRMTRQVLRVGKMIERGWGRIINVASTAGKQGVAFGAPYSASKHAVVGFSKSLGLELAQSGVTVNAVCPGFVETDLARQVRGGFAKLWQCSEDAAKARIEQRIPLGRYVSPREAAQLVGFLASPAQAAITAQAINVCGGLGNY